MMKAKVVALDLQRSIVKSGINLEEAMEKREYGSLSNLFGAYYKAQLSAEFIGREDYTFIYAFYSSCSCRPSG